MAQHDFNIANQVPANLRADLNNAFSAIATNSSGASAPSTTFANQWWYDTTNDLLKIRNEADTAWITVGELDQTSGVWKPYVNGKQIADFLDEDDMASDSATAVPSQQSVKAYIDSITFGVNQSWGNYTASRVANTSYQNTTGKMIAVAIFAAGNSNSIQVSSDGSTWYGTGSVGVAGVHFDAGVALVPDQHYYRLSGTPSAGISYWNELR